MEKLNPIIAHWANCVLSYCRFDDIACDKSGMKLVGGGYDENGKEVHIFIMEEESEIFKKL